jgi:hypothetical protein
MEPSELNRDLIRQDKERRLGNLEQRLVAATRGATVEFSVAKIQKKGLFTVCGNEAATKSETQ